MEEKDCNGGEADHPQIRVLEFRGAEVELECDGCERKGRWKRGQHRCSFVW